MAVRDKIIIFRSSKPSKKNINEELQWFCDSIGLFGDRDKDKSCFRMFIILLRSHREGLSSDEISERVGLSRGTVVHHLKKLMGSGLVLHKGTRYRLRVEKLSDLTDEIERDIVRTLDDLRVVAQDIDKRLNL